MSRVPKELKRYMQRAEREIRVVGDVLHIGPTKEYVDPNQVSTHDCVDELRLWLAELLAEYAEGKPVKPKPSPQPVEQKASTTDVKLKVGQTWGVHHTRPGREELLKAQTRTIEGIANGQVAYKDGHGVQAMCSETAFKRWVTNRSAVFGQKVLATVEAD